MKNYQPDYYNNIKCIADKCSITCCQEWKIAVDDATNRKWKKLSPPDTLSAAPFLWWRNPLDGRIPVCPLESSWQQNFLQRNLSAYV